MSTRLSERCRLALFRLALSAPGGVTLFLMADGRESALRIARAAVSILRDVPVHEVRVRESLSFRELLRAGVSDDPDLRVFEASSKDGKVQAWIEPPIFFTDDATLLGKWAELHADLATETARQVIDRAK
ncbi:hypothetical protein [Caballeronia sp. GAWG2-1]|uniref:hypothetical protein n=1 Tax=Caballeronia sp. GAWG2-1 TaxID=2921744 RepID=UPI00202910EA|nr:hypothetical protein [Caballeronia sp. GAWG2-1]